MISSTTRVAGPFAGTGAQTVFPFTFKIFQASDILVVQTDSTGNVTTLALTTAYSVSLNANQDTSPGGTITTVSAPASGYSITISSQVPALQSTNLTNAGNFYPTVINNALDYLTILVQQLYTSMLGALRFPIGDPSSSVTLPNVATRANNLLAFDANGNPITVAPSAQSATALALQLASTAGSGGIGFSQTKTYAASTVGKKMQQTVCVDDAPFNADPTGATSSSAAVVAASNYLQSIGGGRILFGVGTYSFGTPIPMLPGVTYEGQNRPELSNPTIPGTKLISSTGDLFTNSASAITGCCFKNMWIESTASGGHLFNWSSSGIVAKIEMTGVVLVQGNNAKSIINGTSAGGVFSIWIHDFEYKYAANGLVPPIYIASPTVNSIVIDRFWSTCANQSGTVGGFSIWIESTNSSGQGINNIVSNGVFELPLGGCVSMLSCINSGVEKCSVYDLTVTPKNAQFRFAKGATGPASASCWLRGIRSTVGTSNFPDIQIDLSVAGQTNFTVDSCTATWLDGVSTANGAGISLTGSSSIANFENFNGTILCGSSQGFSLSNSSPGNHSYTFRTGYTGNYAGQLLILQDTTYVGGVLATGQLAWGGSPSAPALYVDSVGGVTTSGHIWPGTPAGAQQNVTGLLGGTGVPVGGNNGDIYFRSDGGAGSTIYQKRSGAWVAVA